MIYMVFRASGILYSYAITHGHLEEEYGHAPQNILGCLAGAFSGNIVGNTVHPRGKIPPPLKPCCFKPKTQPYNGIR